MRNTDNLLKEQTKGGFKQVDINKKYIYLTDQLTRIQHAFEYSGLRRWLRSFIKGVNNDRLALSVNSDSSLLIPSGTWVHGIRTKGSATGITLVFNGRSYKISSAVNGDEIIPQKHYVESDIYLTVTATSWGKLTITVY